MSRPGDVSLAFGVRVRARTTGLTHRLFMIGERQSAAATGAKVLRSHSSHRPRDDGDGRGRRRRRRRGPSSPTAPPRGGDSAHRHRPLERRNNDARRPPRRRTRRRPPPGRRGRKPPRRIIIGECVSPPPGRIDQRREAGRPGGGRVVVPGNIAVLAGEELQLRDLALRGARGHGVRRACDG